MNNIFMLQTKQEARLKLHVKKNTLKNRND